MLSKSTKVQDYREDRIITIIGEDTYVEGIITAESSARIDGRLKGEARFYRQLIVGEKGYINGSVTAPVIIVYGRIEGRIEADILEIKSTGAVTGDMTTHKLSVESGGRFNGNSVMEDRVAEDRAALETNTDNSEVTSFQGFKIKQE